MIYKKHNQISQYLIQKERLTVKRLINRTEGNTMIGGVYELIIQIPIQSGYHSKNKLQEGKEEC